MANRHGKKIETVHWTPAIDSTASLSAGTVAVSLLAAQHLPETILRMRGEWSCWLEGAQTGGAGIAMTAGIVLVPEGTGSTVLWSPITDGDAPWIWWDTFMLSYEEYVTDVIWNSGGPRLSSSCRPFSINHVIAPAGRHFGHVPTDTT